MKDLHQLLADASAWLWPALANHLWQATLFAALVFGATLLLRRGPARVRYALWLAAAAKFALPPALFALLAARLGVGDLRVSAAGAEPGAAAPLVLWIAEPLGAEAADLTAGATGAAAHGELLCALTLVWLGGCAALLAVWFVRRREFLKTVRAGKEAWSGREFEAVARARARLGLRREVLLVLSELRTEPGIWRTLRPVLVLPSEVSAQLDDEELEAVVLHELAHVERRDNLYGNLQTALACVFWFNPVVWLVGRGLFAEREGACDERVLEAGGAAGAYAAGILKVVRFCTGWRVAGVAGVASGSNLRRRIEMIMREEKGGRFSAWHRAVACGFAAAAVALTVGAGLFGGARVGEARMLETGAAAQEPPGARVVRVGRARGAAEQGPGVAEIEQAAETGVYFEQAAGAPVVITEARMRMITREQLRRAEGEDQDSTGGDESPFYVTLPTVTLANMSGKAVRDIGVGYVKNGRADVVAGYAAPMNPGESRTIRSEWRRRNVLLPGTTADVSLRVLWVTYADGTHWGERARVPPPPPAPPLPAPPAPPLPPGEDEPGGVDVSVSAGGGGSGRGTGVGVGAGRGSGGGVGRGGRRPFTPR